VAADDLGLDPAGVGRDRGDRRAVVGGPGRVGGRRGGVEDDDGQGGEGRSQGDAAPHGVSAEAPAGSPLSPSPLLSAFASVSPSVSPSSPPSPAPSSSALASVGSPAGDVRRRTTVAA